MSYYFFNSDDPPSQTTVTAGQELLRLIEANPDGLTYLDPIKDFNMKHLEVVEKVKRVNQLESSINSYQCIECPQFEKHVGLKNFNFVILFPNCKSFYTQNARLTA